MPEPIKVTPLAVHGLYNALLTIIRQNEQGFPIDHDAIVSGRKALARATMRGGDKIDWAKEKKVYGD